MSATTGMSRLCMVIPTDDSQRGLRNRGKNPPTGVLSWRKRGHRDSPEGQAGRAAAGAAGRARRLPVPRRARARHLRRQGEVDPQARRLAFQLAAARCRRSSTTSSRSSSTPRPRRCSPSRTSSSSTGRASTSGCATTSPTRTSRSASTRTSRASTSRASATGASASTSGPYSSAKRVRGTLDLLGKIFLFRSCEGAEPGRRSGSPVPRLLHQALRGPLRRLRDARRSTARASTAWSRSCPAASARSSATSSAGCTSPPASRTTSRRRWSATGCTPSGRCWSASGSRATGRARSTPSPSPSTGMEANAQVFQVRDGVLSDRQSFYLDNQGEQEPAIVAEEFLLQYYTSALAIPSLIVVQQELAEGSELEVLAAAAGRAPRRRGRDPRGRARRQAPHPRAGGAQRAAGARPGEAQGRAPAPAARRGARRAAAGAPARRAAGADRVLRHLARRRHAHGRVDGRVRGRRAEEGRLPALHHPLPRRQRRLRFDERGALAALRAVGEAARAVALRLRPRRVVRRAAEPDRDRRRPGPALGRPRGGAGLPRARRRRRLARQADRGGVHARRGASRCGWRTTRRSCSCSSACATRRTGSRSPTTGSAATRR